MMNRKEIKPTDRTIVQRTVAQLSWRSNLTPLSQATNQVATLAQAVNTHLARMGFAL